MIELIFPNQKPEAEIQFMQAYDNYSRNILRHIYIRVSNRSAAEDILSETFLKTWQFLRQGQEIKNLKSFLYKVANNLIIDYYRKKSDRPVSLTDLIKEPAAEAPSAQDLVDKQFSDVFLKKYLDKLPPRYREIIIYRYLDELSIKEIKQITGKTAANIYVMLHRGLKLLKGSLK
ncbi:MAG: RNA polymerase sigma factor [Parcubacteria group bacterium]|nr:RNA polymerase sigma factor [Parcubacteria group bacterium]